MLKDKVVVITGETIGIGRAITLKLADKGCIIVASYRSVNENLNSLKEELEKRNVKFTLVQGDIAKISDAEELIETAIKEYNKVDILVNNAGITKDTLIMRMKEEDFDSVITTNLKGTFNTVKSVSKYMIKAKGGKIINISSVVGIIGNAGQANYAASKAGINGFTKSVAKELGSRGVTVNAIAPGFIETDMTEVLNDKVKEASLALIPLKRFGSGDDVANLVAFLSSDEANYITGQIINVDGGMVM